MSAIINSYPTSTSMAETHQKKEKKNLRCVVCGARAYGYNFDRITCESCKAFFRRNALKDSNEFSCRFGKICQITPESRRHCTACRIKKCFAVGMRKEWIQSEEEKVIKRQNFEKQRQIKETNRPLQMPMVKQTIAILSSKDQITIKNLMHGYDHYVCEPSRRRSVSSLYEQQKFSFLYEYFNQQKPIIVDLISYFKHLPEFAQIHVDDQVLLIKFNIRYLLPLNCALLQRSSSENIQIFDSPNFHSIYQNLCNNFLVFSSVDATMLKLFLITLFYTVQSKLLESERWKIIYQIQSSYIELFWLYLVEKWGEREAIRWSTKLLSAYLRLQVIIEQIDAHIRSSAHIDALDSIMKIVLQLT